MTKLREIEWRDDKEGFRHWRHSPGVLDFTCFLVLKKFKLNVYCGDRDEIVRVRPRSDVRVKCGIREFR